MPRLGLPAGARGRLAWAGAAVLALALTLAPGPLASASLRALGAAAAFGLAALALRGRLARPAPARRLLVVSRQALSRDTGVALVELDGRAVLVGFGGGGVRLLAEPHRAEPVPEPAPGARPPSHFEVRP